MKSEELEPTPGASRRTSSDGYRIGSDDAAGESDRYQADSDGTKSSECNAGSTPKEDDRMDPYQAFAEAKAKLRAETEARDPAMWLPGTDLDQEPAQPERETRFSTDLHLRGSTQLSVRPTTLARMMVIRGVNAILDAELKGSR